MIALPLPVDGNGGPPDGERARADADAAPDADRPRGKCFRGHDAVVERVEERLATIDAVPGIGRKIGIREHAGIEIQLGDRELGAGERETLRVRLLHPFVEPVDGQGGCRHIRLPCGGGALPLQARKVHGTDGPPVVLQAGSKGFIVGDAECRWFREDQVEDDGFRPAARAERGDGGVRRPRPRPRPLLVVLRPVEAALIDHDGHDLRRGRPGPGQEPRAQVPRLGLEELERARQPEGRGKERRRRPDAGPEEDLPQPARGVGVVAHSDAGEGRLVPHLAGPGLGGGR